MLIPASLRYARFRIFSLVDLSKAILLPIVGGSVVAFAIGKLSPSGFAYAVALALIAWGTIDVWDGTSGIESGIDRVNRRICSNAAARRKSVVKIVLGILHSHLAHLASSSPARSIPDGHLFNRSHQQTDIEEPVMTIRIRILCVAAAALIAQPAAAQQADRTRELYHVFDIKTKTPRRDIIKALTDGININASDSQTMTPLVRGAPPETPGTFELVNPLENSRLGALGSLIGSAQLAQLKQVQCEGAVWIANAQRKITGSQYLRLTLCLFPYTEGYHLDVYGLDTEDKGGGISRKIGRAIAGAFVGDPGDWTNKTIVDLLRTVRKKTTAEIAYVEGQPAFEGEPWEDSYQVMPNEEEKATKGD